MKKQDFVFVIGVAVLLLPFFAFEPVLRWYHSFNAAHGMAMSFLKFAFLSTLGEMIGLRSILPERVRNPAANARMGYIGYGY